MRGLAQSLRGGKFDAVLLDDRAQLHELPGLTEAYDAGDKLGADTPRVFTGAKTVPQVLWVRKPHLDAARPEE